jgi:hypothetical protein
VLATYPTAPTARFPLAPYDPALSPSRRAFFPPISDPALGNGCAPGPRSPARPETPAPQRPYAPTAFRSHGSSTAPPRPANPCMQCTRTAPKNSLARPGSEPMIPIGALGMGFHLPATSRGSRLGAPLRWGPTMPMLLRNLQDRLLELRQLRDEALARRDAVQADELQAEIEDLTAYLEEIFEGTVA